MPSLMDLFPAYRKLRLWSICFLALAVGLLASPAHAETPGSVIELAGLEQFLDEVIPAQLDGLQVPGATVAVVQGGELLVARGYGYADLERNARVDGERTLFRTGSAGKLFTWTAVMQLVEQGRLDLHADVNQYVDFDIPATFPEPVTLAHLMTHTTGFEDVPEPLFVLREEQLMPLDQYVKQHQPARVFPPGQARAYSNYGTALAGYIVQRVSGEPFDAYVENHIFTPLGMARSTLRQPVPADLAGDVAAGYGAGAYHNMKGGFVFAVPYPAGSASAPAGDMAAFMIAHLNGGRNGDAPILQPATVQEMHRRQNGPDPRVDGIAYGFMEQRVNGHHVLFHRGSTFQFNTGLFLLPEEDVGLYVAYNGVGATEAPSLLWQAFMDRYYPGEQLAALTPLPDAARRLAAYTGEYHTARADFTGAGRVISLLESAQVSASPEGRLLLTVEGRTEPYIETEPGLFRHEARDERLVFHEDDTGRLWLSLDGRPAFANFTATSAYSVPWYASLSFSVLVILVALLLFLLSGIAWLVGAVRHRSSRVKLAPPVRVSRWLAASFGLVLLLFLAGFVSLLADMEPAFGVPRMFFGTPPAANLLLVLPWLLAVVAVGMVASAGVLWRGTGEAGGAYVSRWGRLHYTVLALVALVVVWWFWYWNLLALP
jgi:CubicO group peptidase (beta-lactamase class C family)